MTRRAVYWLVVALQALVPFAIAGLNEAGLSSSKDVLLQVQPVDPLDPLRGEYVALQYHISRLDAPAGTVYVPLHRLGDGWTGDIATTGKPGSGMFIRGTADSRGSIRFGIERFYVEEGGARRYEDAMGRARLYARVALDADGKARLRELVIR